MTGVWRGQNGSTQDDPRWQVSRERSGRDPDLHLSVELPHRHAGERRDEDLLEVLHRELRHRLAVAGEHGLEGLDVSRPDFGNIATSTLHSRELRGNPYREGWSKG